MSMPITQQSIEFPPSGQIPRTLLRFFRQDLALPFPQTATGELGFYFGFSFEVLFNRLSKATYLIELAIPLLDRLYYFYFMNGITISKHPS